MKSKERIEHKGRVVEFTPETMIVEFINKSACSACHAKSVCMASDERIKVVEVDRTPYSKFEVGEEVNICLAPTLGYKAVWIAYVIPLIILIILLLILPRFFENELYAGLGSLGVLVVYYIVLYFFRGKLDKKFVFIIEKIKK